MTEPPELPARQPHDVYAGRDAYVAEKIDVTHNHNYQDLRDPLDGAIQDDDDLADLAGRLALERFHGRRQLIAEIEQFIAVRDRGWIVIEGESGVGKSALAMHLVNKTYRLPETKRRWFFHSTFLKGAHSPESARKNLAAQLIRRFELDELAPDGKFPAKGADPAFVARVLKAAGAKNRASGQPIVLVIDSLNEIDSAGESENPVDLPTASELPRNVFVVATRRPAPPPRSLGTPRHMAVIETGKDDGRGSGGVTRTGEQLSHSNIEDMRAYMRDLLEGPAADRDLVQKLRSYDMPPGIFADTLVSRCAGIWIYLKYALDAVRIGELLPTNVSSLPEGVRDYYLDQVSRHRKSEHNEWRNFRLPALAALAALRRPVTLGELGDFAGIDDGYLDALGDWLDSGIRPMLHLDEDPASHETTYEIGHQSLRDVVADETTRDRLGNELRAALRRAQATITTRLMPQGLPGQRDWANADVYARETLAEHAASAGRLGELVVDPGFLLICQPSSVLLRRHSLSAEFTPAVNAYEEALSEWAGLPTDRAERLWRLHVWARKTRAAELAAACGRIIGRPPLIQAAMWAGTTRLALDAHDGLVNTLVTVPTHNGRPLLASGGSDGLIRLWDPVTATPAGNVTAGAGQAEHGDWVMATAVVPLPGQQFLLATGHRDGTLRLWDTATWTPSGGPVAAHQGPVNAITVVVAADNRTTLVSCGRDGTIRLWDPGTRKQLRALTAVGGDWIMAATAVPVDGRQLLATGGRDGTIRLWDPQTGLPVGEPVSAHDGAVNAMAVAALHDDHAVLATAGQDGTLRIWDPRGTAAIAECPGHNGPVNAVTVAWLANRPLFVTAGHDRTVRLWDAATGQAEPLSLDARARWVHALAAVPLPDGRALIAAGGSDGKVQLQELHKSTTGRPATAQPPGHSDPVTAITTTVLAGRTVFVSASRTIRFWDAENGTPVGEPVAGHNRPWNGMTVIALPDGRSLIAASDADGAVRLWDLAAVPPTSRPLKSRALVYAIAQVELRSRTLLVTGGSDRAVRLWDPVSGAPVGEPLTGHVKPVRSIASIRQPEGRTVIAAGGSDGTIRFWDPATGAALGILTGRGKIRAVAAARLPAGQMLFAAGNDDGVVYVWKGTVPDGKFERVAVLDPPADKRAPVNAIAAVELPDRTLLATGGDDSLIRLWDPLAGTLEPGSPMSGHTGPVNAIAPVRLPGGPVLFATGGDDKTILTWTFSGNLDERGGGHGG